MIDSYYEDAIIHVNECSDTFIPGDRVRYKHDVKALGIIIAIEVSEETLKRTITVLWSRKPNELVMASGRRLNFPLIAKQLVNIQPMPVPSSQVFYMDYKYGSGSKQ